MHIKVAVGSQVKAGYGSITAGEMTLQQAQNLGNKLAAYVRPLDTNAPCCCIDGRMCLRTLSGDTTDLRPSVAGGPTTAYAAAELTGWLHDLDLPTEQRYKQVDTYLNEHGINTGNHVDAAALGTDFNDGKTGCGANDRFLENIAHIGNDFSTVSALTAAVLGPKFNSHYLEFTDPKIVEIRNENWDPVAIVDTLRTRNADSIEVLTSDDSPTHGHAECAVVFNYVDGMTVDRDVLVAETGSQIFVVDMWFIDKMARVMAAEEQNERHYQVLKHAMVAYQVGTYLTLCDGSQYTISIRA